MTVNVGFDLSERKLRQQREYYDHLRHVIEQLTPDDKEDEILFSELIQASLLVGHSQKDLAIKLGVDRSTISRWAEGKAFPVALVRRAIIPDLIHIFKERYSSYFAEREVKIKKMQQKIGKGSAQASGPSVNV